MLQPEPRVRLSDKKQNLCSSVQGVKGLDLSPPQIKGCPISRSFFARCGIPQLYTQNLSSPPRASGQHQWYPTSREKRARYGAPGFVAVRKTSMVASFHAPAGRRSRWSTVRESRMKFAYAPNLDRKSGGAEWRDLQFSPLAAEPDRISCDILCGGRLVRWGI
jgi:hypothetical protein